MKRLLVLLIVLFNLPGTLVAQEVPPIESDTTQEGYDDAASSLVDQIDMGSDSPNAKSTPKAKGASAASSNVDRKRNTETAKPENKTSSPKLDKSTTPPKPKSDSDMTAKELIKKYTGSDLLIPDDPVIDRGLGIKKPKRKGPKAKKSLSISKSWRNRSVPSAGPDGKVIYVYGLTMPVLICSPIKLCDIELEPGEVVKDVNTGDTVRWEITPAVEGSGDMEITHIHIKPVESDIETTLIITTDRRSYHFDIRSSEHDYIPRLAFEYPKNRAKTWSNYHYSKKLQQAEKEEAARKASKKSSNPMDFDDDYEISGDDVAWKPRNGDVFNDGRKTYIKMPKSSLHGELPVLHVIGHDGEQEIANYRYRRGVFEVDQVFESAQLTVGVGRSQTKVVITRGSAT